MTEEKPSLKLSNLLKVYKSVKKIGLKATLKEGKVKFASIDDTEAVVKRTILFSFFMFLGSVVILVWQIVIKNWAWILFSFGLVGFMYYNLRTLYKGLLQFRLQKEALNPDSINARMEELYKEGKELEGGYVGVKLNEIKEKTGVCDATGGSIGELPCIQKEEKE